MRGKGSLITGSLFFAYTTYARYVKTKLNKTFDNINSVS